MMRRRPSYGYRKRGTVVATGLSYVGFADTPLVSGNNTVVFPAGTTAGDVALLLAYQNSSSPTTPPSGWTGTSIPGVGGVVYSKVLTSGDIASTVVGFGATATAFNGMSCYTFRGATAVSNLSAQGVSPTVSSKSWAGFAKGAVNGFVLMPIAAAGTAGSTQVISSPTFANGTVVPAAANNYTSGSSIKLATRVLYDFIVTDYTDATAIVETLTAADYSQEAFMVYGLTI